MAYDKDELEKQALAAIKKNKLIFIDEVVSYLPCSKATFYNLKLEQLDSIGDLLNENKVDEKVKLRKKWRETDNAALQTNLYKLCSSDEEQAILNPNKGETTVHVHSEKEEDLTKVNTHDIKQRIAEAKRIIQSRAGDPEEGD